MSSLSTILCLLFDDVHSYDEAKELIPGGLSVKGTRGAKGFFGYEVDLEEEIFEFQQNEYPERDPEQIARKWRWTFLDSAARLGLEPSVWLYRKNDAVVAHQGAIPVLLHIGDKEVSSGWFVETMAATSVRGSPIGPMLKELSVEVQETFKKRLVSRTAKFGPQSLGVMVTTLITANV